MPDAIEKTDATGDFTKGTMGGMIYALAVANAMIVSLVLLLLVALVTPPTNQMPPTLSLIVGLLPVHIGGLLAAVLTLQEGRSGQRLLDLLQLARPQPGESRFILKAVATSLAWFYPLSVGITLLMVLFLLLGGMVSSQPPLLQLLMSAQTPGFLVVALLCIVVVAPVAEEILFRLVIHDSLLLVGRNTALVGTALLFSALHAVPEQVPALFMLGLLLQVTRRRFRSLWAPICLHAGYNAITLLMLYLMLALGVLKAAGGNG